MNRRSFLARGTSVIAGASLVAGCIESFESDDPERQEDGSPDREPGLATDPRDVEAPDVDPGSFERLEIGRTEVPLVPIDVAYPWYLRQDARFVDARSQRTYEASHVAGAVLSPAPDGYDTDDPTEAWSTSERIVTYCGCPHHLSSQRAASLIDEGYESVYALDEGYGEWYDRDYPVASVQESPTIGEARAITGSVDPGYAGGWVWLRHEPTGQREPAEIAADGSFEITFRFVDVDEEDSIVLETPAWTRRRTVAEFTQGTVR